MDNLRAIIKNLFYHMSTGAIAGEAVVYNNISQVTFMNLGNAYMRQYSNDELRNLYFFLENEFLWQKRKFFHEEPGRNSVSKFNVFEALVTFGMEVLIEEDGEPKCQYKHLLRWRDMITNLEEDLFITSYLAYKDVYSANTRKYFFWKPSIGHNNWALNRLTEQGIAENHFHLKGSAPQFHLSWLSLMNDVDNYNFQIILDSYDESRLKRDIEYSPGYNSGKLSHMWRQAALIRAFLMCYLKKVPFQLQQYVVTVGYLSTHLESSDIEKIRNFYAQQGKSFEVDQRINLRDFEHIIDRLAVYQVKMKCSEIYVKSRLAPEDDFRINDHAYRLLKDETGVIQDNVDYLKEEIGKSRYDYAICEDCLVKNDNEDLNDVLAGERWFVYQMFRAIYSNQRPSKEEEIYYNWFYLYIVIKNKIRAELIQTNNNVGFDNFRLYQDRKENFIDGTIYEPVYIRMAVKDTILNQHIYRLEARITPKKAPSALCNNIHTYDKWILDGMDEEKREAFQEKYFYVVHFIKEPEYWEMLPESCKGIFTDYRHKELREKVREQAIALAELRESCCEEALRIKGIDAASSELWCRPEVFGQAFRYMKGHSVHTEAILRTEQRCSHLMATYHVGEDFFDVLDGLRAIDEAIRFLNLRCGDRLGHALALGVDVDEWYESKSNRILINKMSYLDNLTWLYSKIRKYDLSDCEGALNYIEKRFDEYFQEIYLNNLSDDKINYVLEQAQKYYNERQIEHNYNHFVTKANINTYFDAWKLRGDNPELYREGFLKLSDIIIDGWDEYSLNIEFPNDYKIRYNPETVMLIYMYHYNEKVRCIGDQMIEVKVNESIRKAVKKVQKCMQFEIGEMGIGIEANPSSNYLIGTFRRYDRHPIFKWNNLGLTNDPALLQQCPQLQVSINTDDQGVFATYIENEYAYLALALEKCCDEDGRRLFNRTMILQWLDNIRRNGINQSFMAASAQDASVKHLYNA